MPLVLSRRKDQTVCIGDSIRVTVSELHRSSVKLCIEAPREFEVTREETAEMRGRAVVVPGVDLEGMTNDERDRAMAKWLFSPPVEVTGEQAAAIQAGSPLPRFEVEESESRAVVWRGDSIDFAEQFAKFASLDELQAAAGEMILVWSIRRRKENGEKL